MGWGSSLLDQASNASPQSGTGETARWPRAWQAQRQEASPDDNEKRQLQDRIAQLMARNDRRHHPRLAQAAEISFQQLSPPLEIAATNVSSAEVQNFSHGGICIGSPVPLATSTVVQCQIGMPDLRFAIPTLMQVVWLEPMGASEYSVGLRYLL